MTPKSAGSKGSAAAINNTAGASPGGSDGQPAAAEPADELKALKEQMALLEAENERLQKSAADSKAGGDAPAPGRRGRKRGG
jgi:transposase-like protein